MKAANALVIGVDFGTDSVRSVLVNTANGEELASSSFPYPRWAKGLYCDPSQNQFRQHPRDYIEGLEHTIRSCVENAGKGTGVLVKGISVDTTGSTPVAVNESGMPLSLLTGFEENPNAMYVLWKDHTAVQEAWQINDHATEYKENYLQWVGGIYSSEWFWAKLLHILRIDKKVAGACYSWVEHCDWIPFLLTGGSKVSLMKRGVCSAGHKALWAESFGGLPPEDFFSTLDPLLAGFRSRLFEETFPADRPVGHLSPAWADRLGLSTNTIVGIGAFDAHMGAVGGQIEPYHLSKVMGTSTCDMLVAPLHEVKGILVKGICGQVPGSIIPGMMGMEAGQSAFGDAYAWFRSLLTWPLSHSQPPSSAGDAPLQKKWFEEIESGMISSLSDAAASLPPETAQELAIDWLNGRRTPDANQSLKAAITGLSLGTDAPRIFRAIVEATCFGAKSIVDRFVEQGIPVRGLIGLGGVARKSPYIMQMMADTLNMPIRIHRSEQTCALGAAMFAATASGIFPKVEDAMAAMGPGFDKTFSPDHKRTDEYARRFRKYRALGSFIENN
ncbi:MAG: ribulokinase [Chitinophagales bacterium]